MKGKKRFYILFWFSLLLIYALFAARAVPVETVLNPLWVVSLDSSYGDPSNSDGRSLVPIEMGSHFGYVDEAGRFSLLQTKRGYVSFSDDRWAEYGAIPEKIEARSPRGETILVMENNEGYPVFLDDRIFIVSKEQNTIAQINENGIAEWSYDFAAPLTCIDAAAGFLLTGSLDGSIELINENGRRVFSFEPGGSSISIITGCAISKDAARLAVISGIDDQRFLLLERFSNSYRVIYHEFLEDGFRKPVAVKFVDDDRRVVFDRDGALGLYEIASRNSIKLPFEGDIIAIDENTRDGLLFVIMSKNETQKVLYSVMYPNIIALNVPFETDDAFLECRDSKIYIGGGSVLAAFQLDKK